MTISKNDTSTKEYQVLDKGFVRIVDTMGTDSSIVQAARVSYGSGTQSVSNDTILIRYLLRHNHTTPFEMCEIKLHIKAPLFVARQWLRHRTANVNEYSARYSITDEEFYIPKKSDIKQQSTLNKQGRESTIDDEKSEQIIQSMIATSEMAFKYYNDFISPETNVAREIARTILPVNSYTQFYWKIDLHNLLHFLKLRAHPNAQHEIRMYAEAILNIVKEWVPVTYQAFLDYKVQATIFSHIETDLLKRLIKGEKIQKPKSMSKREWTAFQNTLELTNVHIAE